MGARGKPVARGYFAQLVFDAQRAHVAAPRHLAALEELAIARQHDARVGEENEVIQLRHAVLKYFHRAAIAEGARLAVTMFATQRARARQRNESVR